MIGRKTTLKPVSQMPLTQANTAYLCHGAGRVLPFWAQRQMSPDSPSFQTPVATQYFGNTAHRSWTTLRIPETQDHLTVDPVGMCSPNTTWSLDIWVMQAGHFFSLATMPLLQQQFANGEIHVSATLPQVQLQLTIGLQSTPTPAGYLRVTLSDSKAPLSLFFAIRPYGVSDVYPIRDITYLSDGAMMVNKQLALVLSETPQNVLCLPFAEGDSAHHIGHWEQLLKTTCPAEFATGFAEYRITKAHTELYAWLPLSTQLSFAQDLLKPLEQAQLKAWIHSFKTREQAPKTTPSLSEKASLSSLLNTQRYHLTQAPISPDTDPWEWATQLGLLSWTRPDTPEFSQIRQHAIAQNTANLKKNPSPLNACIALSFYAHIQETAPPETLQKAIKVAMTVPIPTQGLSKSEPTHPLDHGFGEGPYWVSYFCAWKTLSLAVSMSQGPQKDQCRQHLSRFEIAVDMALERWAQEQRVSPMLPLSPTRWQEPGIVSGLLAVFPFQIMDIMDIRITNTLLGIEEHALHRGLFFSRDRGYPLVENLLLAMVYRRRDDARCKDILAWALQQISPTGALPQSLHPMTHMGSSGTGHHLAASGLLLTLVRHALVHESPGGYQLCQMLPKQCWEEAWEFQIPIAEGYVDVAYAPEAMTLTVKSQANTPITCTCHPPEFCQASDEDTPFILAAGSTRRIVFSAQ